MDSSTESLAGLNPALEMKKQPPLDLTHLFSETTKRRFPSKMKEYYKFFQIPGIGNLSGGTFYSRMWDGWMAFAMLSVETRRRPDIQCQASSAPPPRGGDRGAISMAESVIEVWETV